MKIGIIGGTGSFGRGLVLRWCARHRILIGSRDVAKAQAVATECRQQAGPEIGSTGILGDTNQAVCAAAEIVVLSLKHNNLTPIMDNCRAALNNKIVISPVAALVKEQFFKCAPFDHGSVAAYIQKQLPQAKVVAALHTIPAHRLRQQDKNIQGDVPVCSDNPEAKKTVMDLIREIKNLSPIDAGPLGAASLVEPIVPLLLNLKIFGGLKSTSVQFV